MADVENEVAPWGLFERSDFEFDDQTGVSTRERWHAGTALVLLPIRLRAQFEFSGDEEAMLANWLTLVDSHPSLAVAVMEAIAETPRVWSLGSSAGARALYGIQKLGSWQALANLLKSCEFIEFQPAIQAAVSAFTTQELVSVLHSVQNPEHGSTMCPSHSWLSSRLNMVASMLHGETDATRIALLLDALPLKPSWWLSRRHPYNDVDETPEEFARLLEVALRVSVDRAKALATTEGGTNAARDAVTIARAVRVLVDWSGGPQNCGEEVLAVVAHASTQLAAILPTIRNAPYLIYRRIGYDASGNCSLCVALDAFVMSTDETTDFDKLTCESHLLDRLKRVDTTGRFTVETIDMATPPRIRLTKIYEDDDFKQAKQHAEALQAVLQGHKAVPRDG